MAVAWEPWERPRRIRRRLRRGAWIAAALVVGLFAVWQLLPRSVTTLPLPPLVPAGPTVLVGDPRAADACALLDPATFPAGTLDPRDPPPAVPGTCALTGTVAPEDRATTGFQRLTTSFALDGDPGDAPAEAPEPAGAVTVLRPAPSATGCRRAVRLTDGMHAVFDVEGSGPSADGRRPIACDTAERAMRLGLAGLAVRGVTSRPGWGTPAPYDHADACVLLGDPGLAAPASPGFGRWNCHTATPTVLVEVDLPLLPRFLTTKGRQRMNEVGYDLSTRLPVPLHTFGYLEAAPSARGTRCEVFAHPRSTALQNQYVRVAVDTFEPGDRACTRAAGVVADMRPRLDVAYVPR